MSLLDLIVVAVVLVIDRFTPVFGALGLPLAVTVALIVERLLKGERL